MKLRGYGGPDVQTFEAVNPCEINLTFTDLRIISSARCNNLSGSTYVGREKPGRPGFFVFNQSNSILQREIAKSHLLALAAMQGSYTGNADKWKALLRAIADFIARVENEGLHE